MKLDFGRFKATDGVELRDWFSDAVGDIAVIHVHGMSGNGYENNFLDNQRKSYNDAGVSFFTFDNRGQGVINHFRVRGGEKKAGSCFEIFEESAHDIQGAIDFVKSKGKSKFVLQGHSLGGSKAVNFLLNHPEESILGVTLLAPTDMVGWARTDPKNPEYLDKAHKLIAQGKPEGLVGSECWLDKTPLSAQTYLTICKERTAVDIFSPREGTALISKVKVPMTIIYGDKDIGIKEIDGDISAWKSKVSKVLNAKTDIRVIPGADHGFTGFEDELARLSTGSLKNYWLKPD